jgi:hypothetical protein
VVAYDRRTGKLAWEAPFEKRGFVAKVDLWAGGEVVVSSVVYREGPQPMTIRVLDVAGGGPLQEIQPEGVSRDWPPILEVGFRTLVVLGKRGVGIYAGEGSGKSAR